MQLRRIPKESQSTSLTTKLLVQGMQRLKGMPQGLWQQEGEVAWSSAKALNHEVSVHAACTAPSTPPEMQLLSPSLLYLPQ